MGVAASPGSEGVKGDSRLEEAEIGARLTVKLPK